MAEDPIEGVDYVVEEGRWVWTAAMLARRGRCCGSGCRNCPYEPRHSGLSDAKVAWPLSAPVASLVPSWTETLVAIGVLPAGRTRFCVHPAPHVARIARVGGTKDLDVEALRALRPRLAILDRQENTREMAAALVELGIEVWASDVRDFESLDAALGDLARVLEAHHVAFDRDAVRLWRKALVEARLAPKRLWTESMLVLRWLGPIPAATVPVAYVIWNRPPMIVGEGTFIAAQWQSRGARLWTPPGSTSLYPTFDPRDLPRPIALLFSTEPFPFGEKNRAETCLSEWGLTGEPDVFAAIVDGEASGWFGVRAIEALERDVRFVRSLHDAPER